MKELARRKIIPFFLVALMMGMYLQGLSEPASAATPTQVWTKHYKLTTGVTFIWCHSDGTTWQKVNGTTASPGTRVTIPFDSTSLGSGLRNVKMYKYDGTNFNFQNPAYYHFNKTAPLGTQPAIYLKNYNTEYYKYAGQIQTTPSSSNTMLSSYDPATGRLWGSYKFDLKTAASIYGKDVKLMLENGQKQAIIDLLGGTPSKEITDAMDLMNPASPKFSPKVKGYLYFAPYITEYEKLETPVSTNNLIMQSVDFIDKNGAVASAISAGESYTARYYVKYVGTDMTETCNVRIGVGNTKNIKTGSVYYIGSPWAKTYPAKMKNGEVIQINVGPFVAKEESAYTDGRLDLDAKYNTNPADDYTEKQIGPPAKGNMELSSIDFLDSSGNSVTEPVLNQMYTARYYVKYTGPTMTNTVVVKLNSGYVRNLKSGSTNYMSSPWSRSMPVKVNSGDVFYFDVGPFKATQLSIYACGTLGPDAKWNATATDDFNEREITGIAENLSLSIECINPPETKVYYPSSQTNQNYEIEYTVNYSTTQNAGLVTDIVLTIPSNSFTNPSSRTITTYVNLSPGTNRFSIFTGSLGVKYGDGSFPITLEVNKSRKAPAKETTFGDNVDSIKEKIESIAPSVVNPCVGTVKEYNSWNVTYNISTKTGSVNTYFQRTCTASYCDDWDSVTGRCTSRTRYTYDCSYWRCVGGNVRNWSQTSTRTENLDIVAVNFTSRGGGTVNLLEKSGYIKAGYGFDLEIIARYWGTESPSRPSEWGGCNYQSVSPGQYAMNPLPNTIYVVLPDGQIISNATSYGIKNLMDCTISGSGSTYQTLRCIIKLGNTFGNKETRKLYVDENTADGTYNMTVCTAKFQPTKPGATTPMFTKDTVRFIVKGKYTDDVTTHIVQ